MILAARPVLVSDFYDNAFVSRNFGYASAVAMVLIAALVQFRDQKEMSE